MEQFNRQAQTQVLDQRQRMTANLVSEIQKNVGEIAKSSGYTLVVNSAVTEAVVYSSGDDLTDSVLKKLNANAPVNVGPPTDVTPITTLLSSTNSPALDFNAR